MKEYKNEMKEFEKKKTEAGVKLERLMELIVVVDEKLREMGRTVNTVDELYEWRKQEIQGSTDDHPSIDFTESENEETDNDDEDEI